MRFLIVKCVSEIIKQYLIILKIFSSFHAAFISFELYSPVSLPLSFLSMRLSISFSCSSSTTEMYTRSKFPAEQLARSSAPFAEKLVIYELANPFPPPPRFHHPHILTRLPLLRVSSSFRWRNFIEPRPSKHSCTFSSGVLSYIISNVGRAYTTSPSIDETTPFRSVFAAIMYALLHGIASRQHNLSPDGIAAPLSRSFRTFDVLTV